MNMRELMRLFFKADKEKYDLVLEIRDEKKKETREHVCLYDDLTVAANHVFIRYTLDLQHKELPNIKIVGADIKERWEQNERDRRKFL